MVRTGRSVDAVLIVIAIASRIGGRLRAPKPPGPA